MIKRILKTSGFLLLLMVLAVAGVLGWAIGTESGLQPTLSLAKKVAPGTLEWDVAAGKLAGPLNLSGLRYTDSDVIDASIGTLDFDWQPSGLLGLKLGVEKLHLDGLEIHLAESTDQPESTTSSGELPDISLPVSIDLNDIVVSNIALYPAGQEAAIAVDRIELSVSVEQSDLHLRELSVIAPQGQMSLTGHVKARDNYPMDLATNWQADIDEFKPLQGEGTFTGSLAQLRMEHQIDGIASADIAATINDIMTSPAWDATVDVNVAQPESLSPLLTGAQEMTLQTSGNLNDYQAQIALDAETTETGPVSVDTDVSGSSDALDINSLVARLDETDAEFSASGKLNFASLHADIEGQWQALDWPLRDEPLYSSATGALVIKGTPDDYEADINASVGGQAIPEGQWSVSAVGSKTELGNFAVQGHTLGGVIEASGKANWEAQPNWSVELTTQGINPGLKWQEFPGDIDIEVGSTGQINDDGANLAADIKQLSGTLRDQPLSGGGRVTVTGENLRIENLSIAHGASLLDVNGQVDSQIALDFDLSSPSLQTLMPEFAGAITMTGALSGSKDAPMLKASGKVSKLSYLDNSVGNLDFNIDGGLAEATESSFSLQASDIAAAGQQISELKLSAQGSEREHNVNLSAATDRGDLSTQLAGGYQNDTWRGSLASLLLENTEAGNWRLREPTDFSANATRADTSPLCLDNSDKLGSVCITGNWLVDGDSTATLNISELSPELASAYLPPELQLDTTLNGDASARLSAEGDMEAEATLALASGKLILESDAEPVEIGLEQTTVDASWRGDKGTVEFAAALTDFGTVNVQGAISDPAGTGRVSGLLNADFADLTLISAFVPQIQEVTGALNSNLTVSGTVQNPQIEGELALRDFSAEIPETAMLIENTQLVISGSPDGTLLLTGSSHSGAGQLDINGRFDASNRTLELNVNGDQYEVANTALMQATVSPDLSIAMDDKGMEVNGAVTIPSAYINANGGNEGIKTVSSSSDVVYVSEEDEQAETAPSQISLDVQVNLGDSIEVEAGDFRGRLEGDLRVEQTPELAPRGTGTITVVNGDYVIYGQQLDMERGKILFSGGPVDNPSLDMQVARTVQEYEVVAGARIQGTAQAPRLELYSDPSMPDASILSFILLGQPPGTTGASYTLGKYLTPDLYVSYGIGLFDAINTFSMRYSLTDKLAVEAASGVGNSTDLIYTIEK